MLIVVWRSVDILVVGGANGGFARWIVNWEVFGRRRTWLNRDTVLLFDWRGFGRRQKLTVTISGVSAEIRPMDIRSRNLERQLWTNAVGMIFARQVYL
jgi:hypothetical protein